MTNPSPENPGMLNWVLVLALSVIWGGAFLSVKISLEAFPPMTVAAMRTGLATVVLLGLSKVFGQGLGTVKTARGWWFSALIGLGAVALPFGLLSWGQQFVPSAFAGVSMGAVPLLVLPLVAVFSAEEGIGPRRIIGFVVGFAGLVVLFGPSAFGETDVSGGLQLAGQIACVSAAGCYAVGSVVTRRAPTMPPLALATASTGIAALVLVPLALVIDGIPAELPLRPTLAACYAALFPTALAAVIRVRVITTAGSLFMSITSYLVPLWSVIFGVLILSEDLPNRLFYALGLILFGIAISQSRALQARLTR